MNFFKKITVVGGGTAGLISALILKTKFTNSNITVIKSDEIGIIGVGEGSTEHWSEFLKFCNISFNELIKECDATIKYGVMFENWTPKNYYHSITKLYDNDLKLSQYLIGYAHHICNHNEQIKTADQHYIKNTIFKNDFDNNFSPSNQYHFNTFKLNNFLLKKCIEKNIIIINDKIEENAFKKLKEKKIIIFQIFI